MKRTYEIKRVCVSALTEIERKEPVFYSTYPTQPEVGSTCKKCQRERTRNRDFRHKHKGRRKPATRANTPIVIQLEDTIRAAIQQRQKSRENLLKKQESSETAEGGGETDNSSDSRESEGKDNRTCKNVKNFSAFITAVEKVPEKDINCVKGNINPDKSSNEKKVAEFVLNNTPLAQTSTKAVAKKRSIVECENVEVICNDLNSVESTVEDTEESEIASTTSSSEIQSDSDTSNVHDGPVCQEFSPDELKKLADYTTGCPLIRYECPPSECPQCQWYNNQILDQETVCHNSKATQKLSQRSSRHNKHSTKSAQKSYHHRVPSFPQCTESQETSNSDSEQEDIADQDVSIGEPCHSGDSGLYYNSRWPLEGKNTYFRSDRLSNHKQLLDIDIAGKQKSLYGLQSSQFLDSVYIDLTDSDVSFTVYYHHNLIENQGYTSFSSTYAKYTLSNITGPHLHGPVSPFFSVPYYHQYVYWPSYYTPMYNLTAPFCLPPDDKLPKTAMIPPDELPKFNASQPPHRHWMPLARPEPGRHAAIFTVMCYNVLCDKYCTRQQYGYCPSWGLNWEYRKKGIMDEIRNCSADVICLQEVETDQFYNFFMPELERDGYTGIFSPKSRARTMTEQERKHVDGCAIFFRTTKFRLMKEHLIEFNQLAMANAEGSDEMLNRVMTKDNIGLAALLETKDGVFESSGGGMPPEGLTKQPILIVTAHMHWDPEFSDVKLIQTMMLMSELKRIVEESYHLVRPSAPPNAMPDCNTIPMILCGDLNSLPESGVIEYLSSGKVAGNHCDFKELGYEACLQTFNCNKDGTQLTHNFRLARAYENEDMPQTNYTYDFKGIIDYIFFSKKYMNLLGLLGPMDENWFTDNKVVGCPHPHIPSDHFALFVEFELPVPYPAISEVLSDSKTSGSSSGRDSSSSGGNLPKLR